MRRITHLINAKSFESTSGNVGPIYNPATGKQTGEVDLASVEEVDLAVESSKNAFQESHDFRGKSALGITDIPFSSATFSNLIPTSGSILLFLCC